MNTASPLRLIAVTGPTATGKTKLAVELARRFHGEIVSVDSRQVYRGMDLGTGKDLEDYGDIPCHLIDIADPGEIYDLSRFVRDAWQAMEDIESRRRLPILCGGTAMYLDALLRGYRLPGGKRAAHAPHHRTTEDKAAPPSFQPPRPIEALTIGVYYPRETVRRRIEERLDQRLAAGMIDEVRGLHEAGVSYEKLEFFGLEYREIARFLQGQCDLPAMRQTLLDRIRQFAKRQDVFFRKMEREGLRIHWCRAGNDPDPAALAATFLAGQPVPEPALRMLDIHYGKIQP
ncbi:MAG: tRNA dimethylallyltransferase [Lentisphaeria bacterium]|nr:tRNA dimethylallyltransferase [Lentisphaeria bacterium]